MASPQKEERAIFEAIRTGKAPSVVKRQASRGTIPVAADELLEILVFLTKDPDPTCSEVAKQTLTGWPVEKCAALLAQPDASPEVLTYFASQEEVPAAIVAAIARHPKAGDEALAPLVGRLSLEQVEQIAGNDARLAETPKFVAGLLERSDLPAELRSRLQRLHPRQAPPQEKPVQAPVSPEQKRERITLVQKLARMTVSERVQLALKGSKEERLVLIRDPNRVVYRAVLESPKLTDSELEGFASMKNIADEGLRIIAGNRQFLKNYAVVRNLVNNPRTPIDVSLNLLNRLISQDLKFLTINRNVPETVRAKAFRLHKQRITRGATR